MKKKIILSSILALGVLGGVVGLAQRPIGAEAASITAGTKLYLKPSGNWLEAGAWFACYYFSSNGNSWSKFVDDNGDGIYETTSPTGTFTNCIMVRKNPSNTGLDWNGNWGQTADLTYDGNKNLYTVVNWNDTGSGWTSNFTETYYLPGNFNGWDAVADQLTDEDKNGTYEVTKELEAGTYAFKVALNGTWDTPAGLSTANTYTDTVANLQLTIGQSTKDIGLTATGGTYTFAYTPTTKKLTITHVPADTTNEDVCNLLTSYYNEGTYTRNTTINLNTEALDDISTHFHGSVVLERTTYFKPGELWMTRGENSTTYSYYGTSGKNMTTGTATEVGIAPEKLGIVTNDHKDWDPNGKDENGMEGFYITLKDIMEKASTVEWTYSNGVYSTAGLTEEFLAFTAPCLLDTQHYVQYTGVEVEEVGETLVLRLLASETNSGALSVETNVLSQAVITK